MESLGSLILLILFSFLAIIIMNKFLRKFGLGVINPISILISYFTKPPLKENGMMNKQDELKIFSKFNNGVLLDGKNKRLSQEESCKHVALISRTGGGKTSSYIIPNLFKLANEKCSFVVTDLSGELYDKTSGYLERKGFKIYVLDPSRLDESIRYNPLEFANSSYAIDMLSETLIASSGLKGEKAEDRIWSDGAKSFISILIKALKGTNDKRFMNLANVRFLINSFGSNGKSLHEFMKRYADDKTFIEYKGFVAGNEKTIQSFITTANIALSAIGINENLEKLTYSNTINFSKLREEKSVVYIRVEQQYQEQYSFLLNLFYSQLFNKMLEKIPTNKDLPIYCLLDEFGNMSIPKFPTIITTIRKYKVSISIVLQTTSQLSEVYSQNKAKTILEGGITTKIVFSGSDSELASKLEKIFGIKDTLKRQANGDYYYDKENVMSINDIMNMADDEVLVVHSNKKPLRIMVKPYYKDMMYKSFSKIKPYMINQLNSDEQVEYIDLNNIEW